MEAENDVEGSFKEIQSESFMSMYLNSHMEESSVSMDQYPQMGEATEVSEQDQPSTSPKLQEMKMSNGNQIAPMEMVPYSGNGNNNIPAEATPPSTRQVAIYSNIDTTSRMCKNILSLLLFLIHIVASGGAIGYMGFLGIKETIKSEKHKFHIENWYPQLTVAAAVGALFSCVWQTLIRWYPEIMVKGVLWFCPAVSFAAAIFLISTSIAASVGLGVVLLVFSICQALYACWVTPRLEYAARVLSKALAPGTKLIPDLCHPSYWMILVAFVWTIVWSFGVVGAITNDYVALIIVGLLVSFAWTMEVLRNVVNVTVSRVIALFYMRGMQSDTRFAFHRAFTTSLGSICLGSITVPMIESLRVV